MKKMINVLGTILFLFLFIGCGFSQELGIRKKQFNISKTQLAIGGYDPVAYFTESKAVKGSPTLTHQHDGIVYQFANEKNKKAFVQNPNMYEPQYGGWCAYAMGEDGSKVEIDPNTFKIINGKLYLFYNKKGNNTLATWNKNEAALKSKADINWKIKTSK